MRAGVVRHLDCERKSFVDSMKTPEKKMVSILYHQILVKAYDGLRAANKNHAEAQDRE